MPNVTTWSKRVPREWARRSGYRPRHGELAPAALSVLRRSVASAACPKDPDIAYLKARHRLHVRAEDRIKEAKECGLSDFLCSSFRANRV